MKISNAVLSVIEWVHYDLQCYWHSEQFRHQEKFVKTLKKKTQLKTENTVIVLWADRQKED